MATEEKWYFTKEQLANTPSRKCGIDADKELSYRQQAANFIQDMGQRLVVTQLCINTAIVYMHRFYVFHSLSQFHRNSIASAALFLAAKVEEQPRKLEHVIKVAHMCLHRDTSPLDVRSEAYQSEAHDLVFNENVLLQTLGFDVAIDHPHTHVVRCCHLVKASKDLAQTSYFMASNSLHLTTMCLQYKPTVVACFCIHLACKWSNWEIPQSNEGKSWFWYVDRSVTSELLAQLTAEFLHIFDKCPSRLKKKIMSISERQSPSMHHPSLPNSPFDVEPRRVAAVDDGGPSFQSARPYPAEEDKKKPASQPSSARPPTDYREYRDKKERERLEREKLSQSTGSLPQDKHHHPHHHKPSVPGPLLSGASSSMSLAPGSGTPISKHMVPQKAAVHHNHHHHHHHRPDLKLQQKHSSSAPRDSGSFRQRIPRDYQQPPNYSQHQLANNHAAAPKDSNPLLGDAVDPAAPDASHLDKSSSNNNHSARPALFDKRSFDPRHKIVDHRKEDQKNSQFPNPPPPKYPEHIRSNDRLSRKLPELEQRSEEVRKLIEKPLPIPKPRAEIHKEEYIANMLKQSHNPNKLAHNSRIFPHDLSKQPQPGLVKPQVHQQQQLQQQQQQQQLIHQHPHMSLIFKEKNGIQMNPNLAINDDKIDKRKHDELTQVPLIKHKSLFSPDKITPPQDLNLNQRKFLNKKTPPASSSKLIKQELNQDVLDLNTQSLFSMSPELNLKRELPQEQKIKSEENNLEKKPRMGDIKPEKLPIFEAELLFNGPSLKTESDLSPMKSAQGISALLQEPLAPMPSLLQTLSSDEGIFSQVSGPVEASQNFQDLPSGQKPTALGSSQPNISQEEPFVSTVDISLFSSPVVSSQVPIVVPAAPETPGAVSKKQENHHKSEKKKKKEKHKHKDKDKDKEKSKDKHKHKHKDKDKHRDKEKDKEKEKSKDGGVDKRDKHDDSVTAPIRITIPKDKLNLVDTPDGKKKSPSAGIKIKIPKERLKNKEAPAAGHQGPLKIKIRTNATASGQPEGYNIENRKRERGDDANQPPAKKFHGQSGQVGQVGQPGQAAQAGQPQRGSDRQNGRHYSSSNNKEKHSSKDTKTSISKLISHHQT
ncbi:uncharacterized protein LOC141532717 [Cotesia typhae]|uniref:uncharacterized protein LOC141532717 n=1 Tax=Cotesia typhae TaxID=2053667 RepID=UPI003D690E51